MFRQLAPSVGTARAGLASFPTSSSQGSLTPVNSTIHGSTTLTTSICFGSVEFMPHSQASSLAFSNLDGSIDLAFGDFRFHANREGMLRFPDSLPAKKFVSTTSASSSSSSDSDSEKRNSSIYREDDDYHSTESEELVNAGYIDDYSPHVAHDTVYPAHVCMAGSTSSMSSVERRTIGVSQASWDRDKDAVERSIVLPSGAFQEELQAYHIFSRRKPRR